MISTTNSPEEILSQISLSISHLSNSLVDNSYLLNQLDLKDLKIKELNQQIDDLNKKIYSVYQTTWR
jgi:peptidoglycan hydrolase CwlO-like protein